MKSFLIIFIIYPFSLLTHSCGTNDVKHSEKTENAISKIEYLPVKSGVLYGAGEEGISQGIIGVSNTQELNALRSKMNTVNEELEEDVIPDLHFFDEEMLIFIFDKVRGTGGYTFEVEEIIEHKEMLEIQVLSKRPADPATSVMTQPYQIVSIPKSNKELTLVIIE